MFLKILVAIMGVLMSIGYFPQAYKIYRTKLASDISIPTYVIFSVGTLVWALYGFYIGDISLVISFAVGILGSWSVLGLTLYYRRK